MIRQFFANFTWLDICILIIIVRGCWSGFQKGFLVEIFKLIGILLAVFIALHFYLPCGDFLIKMLRIFKPVAHIFSYILLIGMTVGIFRIVRDGMIVLLRDKDNDVSFINRNIGLIMGFCRSLVLSSLLLVGCLLVDHVPLTRTVHRSFTAPSILSISPKLYAGTFRMVGFLFPHEKRNEKIMALVKFNKRTFD